MRKRYIEEHNDADSEPGDHLSVADSHTQTQNIENRAVESNKTGHVAVPLNPDILTKQPIVISTSKRPFQQTNNQENVVAPKKGAVPEKVQIHIIPRARLPPAPIPQKPAAVTEKPTIIQVNTDDDNDSVISDSPRTRSLRMIAQTVKTYY
jgi:hypothetical protein